MTVSKLPPDLTELLAIKKLFFADEQPVILVENYIPFNLLQAPYELKMFHSPIYRVLAELTQLHLAYYVSEIVPLVPQPWLADNLKLKPRTALLSFDEIGYTQENQPILKSCSYFKDDLLRLRLLRRETIK